MHALPAKQRVPKLSCYNSSIHSRVVDTITSFLGKSISDRTWTERQQTFNLRSFLSAHPWYVFPSGHWVFLQWPKRYAA